MFKNRKFFYLVCLILIAGISYWGIFLNKSTLVVISNLEGEFNLTVDEQLFVCDKSCTLELKPKVYKVKLEKEGYTSSQETVSLAVKKSKKINYSPVFIPQLIASSLNIAELQQDNYQIKINNNGYQEILILDQNTKNYITAYTFKNPLTSPKVLLLPNLSYFYIYESDDLQKGYLIDKDSAKINFIEIEIQEKVIDVALLNETFLVLSALAQAPQSQSDNLINQSSQTPLNNPTSPNTLISPTAITSSTSQTELSEQENISIYLYNIHTKSKLILPIANIKHIQSLAYLNPHFTLSDFEYFILTSNHYESSQTQVAQFNLSDMIKSNSDDKPLQFNVKPTFLYGYNPELRIFKFLQTLPNDLDEAVRLETLLINNSPEIFLTDDKKIYSIVVK